MAKVIKKKVKLSMGDDDSNISDMFNQMLGAGAVNMTIAYPRYLKIKEYIDRLLELFEKMSEFQYLRSNKEFETYCTELEHFVKTGRDQWKQMFSIDFSEYEWDLNTVQEEEKKLFSEEYEKMKKSQLINGFIIMCDRIIPYKRHFNDIEKLDGGFIVSMSGVEFCPFPFTHLNLKQIFTSPNLPANVKTFFLIVLHKSLEISHKLWTEITSPDIDVDEFIKVIMTSIKEVQKRPELNRCRKAFKKIEDSVHLLKGRFNNYYRDFIQTKNSSIIMEHFILDVSKNTKADAETTRQFRQIITYYRKIAQEKITDPRVKGLFDKVNESLKELERGTNNLSNLEAELEQDEEEESSEEEEEIVNEDDEKLKKAQTESATKTVDELVDYINGSNKK